MGFGFGSVRRGLAIAQALALAAASLAQAQAHPADDPALPALEAFAHLPRITRAALSPDGKRVAELRNLEDQTVLVTRTLDSDDPPRVVMRSDKHRFTIRWFKWVSDERLVVGTRGVGVGLMEIDHGEVGMISVRADGSGAFRLLERLSDFSPIGGSYTSGGVALPTRVVDWIPDDGHHILVEIVEPGNVDASVYSVNVDTNGSKRVLRDHPDISNWLTDATHRVRVGLRRREDDVAVMVCDPDGSNWRVAWRYKTLSRESVWPLGFGTDPNRLFVSADHQGRRAIFEVDLRDAQLTRQLKFSHPVHDVGGPLLHSKATGEAVGVWSGRIGAATDESAGAAQESGQAHYWVSAFRRPLDAVDRALPGSQNHILTWSNDNQRALVHSTANGRPDQFFVARFSDAAPPQLQALIDPYPELALDQLVGKRPVRVEARDGRLLMALLTLPRGPVTTGLPAVVMPRSGAQADDDMRFDPWVEFLASRGYAVLQLDFRGSIGEGYEHMAAGLQRWGLEMQDDISDATQWLIRSGVADSGRVAIVGASYGGYAALMGVVRTPGLYRCAVSLAGVTDLIELARRFWDNRTLRASFERQIGDPDRDREQLLATSPARLASRIQVPVLLLHGTEDSTVPYSQSEAMAAALKASGKTHKLVTLAQGDHALSRNEHRAAYLRELEGFLAENLAAGGGAKVADAVAPAPPPGH
jgi:dipeptidyl aminopeptidase/acylaminoacyl peptidase